MASSIPGKLNTFVQIRPVFALIIHLSGKASIAGLLLLLFAVAFITALISGGQYAAVWGLKATLLP